MGGPRCARLGRRTAARLEALPSEASRRPPWAADEDSVQLLREVVLDADLADRLQLGLEPVDVLLLRHEDVLQQLSVQPRPFEKQGGSLARLGRSGGRLREERYEVFGPDDPDRDAIVVERRRRFDRLIGQRVR